MASPSSVCALAKPASVTIKAPVTIALKTVRRSIRHFPLGVRGSSRGTQTSSLAGSEAIAISAASSLAYYFYEHALAAPAVEFAVKNPLPRTEIKLAVGDRNYDLAAHDLTLVVCIAVVLAGAVVMVAGRAWIIRRQRFEPSLVVVVQAGLVVVDEDGGGDVHGVDEAQAFAHAALANGILDLARDIHEIHARGNIHREIPGMRSHRSSSGVVFPKDNEPARTCHKRCRTP